MFLCNKINISIGAENTFIIYRRKVGAMDRSWKYSEETPMTLGSLQRWNTWVVYYKIKMISSKMRKQNTYRWTLFVFGRWKFFLFVCCNSLVGFNTYKLYIWLSFWFSYIYFFSVAFVKQNVHILLYFFFIYLYWYLSKRSGKFCCISFCLHYNQKETDKTQKHLE